MIKFIKMASIMVAAFPLFWSGGASAISLPGILESGYPNFENATDTYVNIKYQRADNVSNKLTVEAKRITGTFNLTDTTDYTVDNFTFKLRANFTASIDPDIDPEFIMAGSTVRINGNISGLGANGKLFEANLVDFNTDGSKIGFDTVITYCHDAIAAYCTTNESVYLYDFGGGFSLGDKKFRERGQSITTIPVPAAVWLFGSGLLGLVSIAKRKKAAAA